MIDKPAEVIAIHQEICASAGCPHGHRATDPCATCPNGHWGRYTADCKEPAHGLGLGDMVAAVATPIARALGMPCIDPETKQLRPESGCGKRKAALNKIHL